MTTTSTFDRKTAFLSTQIRTLAPLPPLPPSWQDRLPADEHGDLSANVVNQVFLKLNAVARKHHRIVYSTQALRQVAEQIDTLYWEASNGEDGIEDDVLRRGVDLKDPENIERLPEEPPSEGGESPEELARYEELRNALIKNTSLLTALRRKHAYYRNIKGFVQPFENPAESVQPNLVTSSGRIGEELAEIKILAAKLAATIEEVKLRKKNDPTEGTAELSEDQRLKMLLGL